MSVSVPNNIIVRVNKKSSRSRNATIAADAIQIPQPVPFSIVRLAYAQNDEQCQCRNSDECGVGRKQTGVGRAQTGVDRGNPNQRPGRT